MERFVFLTIAMVCNQLQQFHITAQTNVSCIEYGKQYFICVYLSSTIRRYAQTNETFNLF